MSHQNVLFLKFINHDLRAEERPCNRSAKHTPPISLHRLHRRLLKSEQYSYTTFHDAIQIERPRTRTWARQLCCLWIRSALAKFLCHPTLPLQERIFLNPSPIFDCFTTKPTRWDQDTRGPGRTSGSPGLTRPGSARATRGRSLPPSKIGHLPNGPTMPFP